MNPLPDKISPKQGFVKPPTGPKPKLGYVPVGAAQTRRKKVASPLRVVIANNVTRRARVVFALSKNIPVDIRKASAEHDIDRIARSTIQRILERKTSATLEQLDRLATALDVSPYQLLIPELDPRNPQVAAGATAAEESLYRKIAREEAERVLSTTRPDLPRRTKPKQ